MSDHKTAFVTGASRGIGRAIVLALAEAGFDVAITARTMEPGERREHSPSVKLSIKTALPGSLTETAALMEQAGQRVILAPEDIVDRASLGSAATMVLERWGHVDVVVHKREDASGPAIWTPSWIRRSARSRTTWKATFSPPSCSTSSSCRG